MEILVITPVTDKALERIRDVDPRVNVVDARGWFDGELRDTYPDYTVQRYLGNRKMPEKGQKERDRVLSTAEIILMGWPPPLDLRARSPRLRWVHQLPAGASNLLRSDLWEGEIVVTTSRGYGNTRPMAEYVLASFLYFARGLHMANRDQRRHCFGHALYRPLMLEGKTACVVGAGGIGREVARLCAGAGMRVVGTRRHVPQRNDESNAFSRIEAPEKLYELLKESHFVAVCCQWTPETTKLIDRKAFAVMEPETVLVNVARGEIIDEEALIEALDAKRIRGVALDVYVGEFDREPDRRLWDDDRVLITPHISGGTEVSQHRGVELFCENLKAYIEGREMINVIDWERGY